MGVVLNMAGYRAQEKASDRKTKPASRDGAEIVIFPGVRVERHTIDLSVRQHSVTGSIIGCGDSGTG
ncbi:MAG: hypothetical protein AAGL24_03520 [Pseudomonadota bacterium]